MPFDIPEESIFVLIFLLISFFNWIGEKMKKARMEGDRSRPQAREFEEEPPDFPPLPPSPTPPRPSTSRQENPMRQILESLGIPVEEEPPIVTEKPPALPPALSTIRQPVPPKAKPTRVAEVKNPWAREELTAEEAKAMKRFEGGQSEAHRRAHTGISKEVRELLTPEHAKTAFVLKEVLGQPKCFDS